MDKKKYVLAQKQDRKHVCHWPGCRQQVPPAMWGCKKHWYKLPKQLRDKIWTAYEPGQEISLTPSDKYLAVAMETQAWIAEYLRSAGPDYSDAAFQAGPHVYGEKP